MSNVQHLIGISGGKDSCALAIYLNNKYPQMDFTYYSADTGKELAETYVLIDQLEKELEKPIEILESIDFKNQNLDSVFDYYLEQYDNYLPSSMARWCTKKMKILPFEQWIDNRPTISYVGIRGDEDREGYISTKPHIQSIFPFRKNIWSVDVINLFFKADKTFIKATYSKYLNGDVLSKIEEIIDRKLNITFTKDKKIDALLNLNIKAFNKVIFDFLKTTDLPVGKLNYFPLVENDEILVRDDIFEIIEQSVVDLPGYYKPLLYEVDGEKGQYSRSRSGCFFCFYQQKIEWVWLLEQHPDLFQKAMEYEKKGYSWVQTESLKELSEPTRVEAIKREHLKRMKAKYKNMTSETDWQDNILGVSKSKDTDNEFWLDELKDAEGDGCASCFI